jgi:hypothetical protein
VDLIPNKRIPEPTPEPGSYDSTLKPFGADVMGNIDMGKKYVTKYNNNPPPGLYNIEAADSMLYAKTPSTFIREEMTADQVGSPNNQSFFQNKSMVQSKSFAQNKSFVNSIPSLKNKSP